MNLEKMPNCRPKGRRYIWRYTWRYIWRYIWRHI
jgi:hypothetical protein